MHTRYELYSLVAPVADNFESSEEKDSTATESHVDFVPSHMSQHFFADYSEPAFVVKKKEEG